MCLHTFARAAEWYGVEDARQVVDSEGKVDAKQCYLVVEELARLADKAGLDLPRWDASVCAHSVYRIMVCPLRSLFVSVRK